MGNINRMKTSLIVNGEKNNASMGLKKMFFDKFDGEAIVEINSGGYLNNGYLYIEVNTNSKIELFYKNILIFSTEKSVQKLIPCLFENDTVLKISGSSDQLSIVINGAEFVDRKSVYYFLPQNNKVVKYLGQQYKVYGYNDVSQIIQNNCTVEFDINNLKSIQTISINDVNYLGYLYFDDQLYFVSNVDNYTNKYIIIDDCNDATIVPDKLNNCIYFVYIKQNKLFYKIMNSDMILSEEIATNINFNDILKGFSQVVIKNFGEPLFVLNLNSDRSLIMVLQNDEIKCRLIKKASNIELYQDDINLEVFTFEANLLNVSKYKIEKSYEDISIVSITKSKQVYNVDRIMKIDNNYLLYNSEYCTEVGNEELFSD